MGEGLGGSGGVGEPDLAEAAVVFEEDSVAAGPVAAREEAGGFGRVSAPSCDVLVSSSAGPIFFLMLIEGGERVPCSQAWLKTSTSAKRPAGFGTRIPDRRALALGENHMG